MAFGVKNKVQKNDIINTFVNKVKNVILKDAYHVGKIPYCQGYQCIPTSMLGNVAAIKNPENIGTEGNIISASNLYNSLVEITTTLTRVGTFTYVRRLRTDSGYRVTGSLSGKALFTEDYLRTLPTVVNNDVVAGKQVTVKAINNLINNCLTAWNSASKYNYEKTVDYCHSSCHSNCHSNCNTTCHNICYGNGACNVRPGCWDGLCYNSCNEVYDDDGNVVCHQVGGFCHRALH